MRKLMIAIFVVTATAAAAQDEAKKPRPWQFYWENDAGAVFSGSDEYYTNGLRLTVGSTAANPWAEKFRKGYCRRGFCKGFVPNQSVSYAFGHLFYTPEDISDAAPQPLDRPWAGWMYGAVNVQIGDDLGERQQHMFELQVGILGQGAGAQFTQTEFHEIIGDERPMGWANQLKNEPAANLLYTQNRRFGGSYGDVIVSPGFVLGTLATYPSLGATGRLGINITGFPATPLGPAAAPAGTERPRFEAYAFGGADARYVLHNALLDGGFFRNGQGVDRKNDVIDLRAGASIRYQNLRLTYTFVRRSEEFTPAPPRQEGRHDFGSLVIAWEPQRE